MTITTSKGKTYPVSWAWELTKRGKLKIALEDGRRLPEIAAEFDGVERFDRSSEKEGNAVYEGYTHLAAILRNERTNEVEMTFTKEE